MLFDTRPPPVTRTYSSFETDDPAHPCVGSARGDPTRPYMETVLGDPLRDNKNQAQSPCMDLRVQEEPDQSTDDEERESVRQ